MLLVFDFDDTLIKTEEIILDIYRAISPSKIAFDIYRTLDSKLLLTFKNYYEKIGTFIRLAYEYGYISLRDAIYLEKKLKEVHPIVYPEVLTELAKKYKVAVCTWGDDLIQSDKFDRYISTSNTEIKFIVAKNPKHKVTKIVEVVSNLAYPDEEVYLIGNNLMVDILEPAKLLCDIYKVRGIWVVNSYGTKVELSSVPVKLVKPYLLNDYLKVLLKGDDILWEK